MNAAKVFYQCYVVTGFVASSVFENHVLDLSAVTVDENLVSAHWSYYCWCLFIGSSVLIQKVCFIFYWCAQAEFSRKTQVCTVLKRGAHCPHEYEYQ